MLASLACALRRLTCRCWAGRVALRENRARQHHPAGPGGSEAGAPLCPACAPPAPGAAPLGTARSRRAIVPFTHLAREGRMTVIIGRRELLVALGGVAAWPLAARAQQPAMPEIGFLSSTTPDTFADRLRGFRQGLKETGFVEGENVAIVYRFAENQDDRLPA